MYDNNKTYESLKILRKPSSEDAEAQISQTASSHAVSFGAPGFAEVEIGTSGERSQAAAIPKPQTIVPPTDEKLILFRAMRQLARDNASPLFARSNFYTKQSQPYASKIFYKQAEFMKDFEDDYTNPVPFSSYFPYFQLMSYEQLRTYFTWRTRIRNGDIKKVSMSYAFLYIYELLNNIGVSDPQDGLSKLMAFWNAYRAFDTTPDKYILRWLKDYHVYYELPVPFKTFVIENNLQMHYPNVLVYDRGAEHGFELYCGISRYDITQSVFYSGENGELIRDCIDFVIVRIREKFGEAGIDFDKLFFQPTKNMSAWTPFGDALFFPWVDQPDRYVALSEREVYICKHNTWTFSTAFAMDSGKNLVSYIIKQAEAALRKMVRFKYKITANIANIDSALLRKLGEAGVSIEDAVNSAVAEFYAERTKTVVSVDRDALRRIRLEALDTQEKLVVPEDTMPILAVLQDEEQSIAEEIAMRTDVSILRDSWTILKDTLTAAEIEVISIAISGENSIKRFADEMGVMLEVLADNVNEKAMDCIGDNILELDGDAFVIYDEYVEKLVEMVES